MGGVAWRKGSAERKVREQCFVVVVFLGHRKEWGLLYIPGSKIRLKLFLD